MKKQRVTLRDVARACGVTASAVSYALRGSPEVSEALRERIAEAARALGYVPSGAARRLRGGALPRRIGILGAIPALPHHARNIEALERAAAAAGVETVVSYHYWHRKTERRLLASLLDSGVSGLVIHPASRETGETLAELAQAGLAAPTALFGEVKAHAALAPFLRGCYHPQPREITDLCLPEVLARGHRRVAFLFQGPLFPEGSVIQTLRHFQEKSAPHSGQLEFFYLDDSSSPVRQKVLKGEPCRMADFLETDRLLAEQFLDSPSEATAVITQDDLTALALLAGCRRRGRRVPEALSVMSIGGTFTCEWGEQPVTHLAVRIDEIAADLLERLLAGPPRRSPAAAYPMRFEAGATLGMAPGSAPSSRRTGRGTASLSF